MLSVMSSPDNVVIKWYFVRIFSLQYFRICRGIFRHLGYREHVLELGGGEGVCNGISCTLGLSLSPLLGNWERYFSVSTDTLKTIDLGPVKVPRTLTYDKFYSK